MCLSKDEVVPVLVRWGAWHWHNAGYGEKLGYSSDGNMHSVHLATAACGGGNKVDNYEDMPADVLITHNDLSKLSVNHIVLCDRIFRTPFTIEELPIKTRISEAKHFYLKKFEINPRAYQDHVKSLWVAVGAVLDDVKMGNNHPLYCMNSEKSA